MDYTTPLNLPMPAIGDRLDDTIYTAPRALALALNDYLNGLTAVAPVTWTDVSLASGWSHLDASTGLPGGVGERSQYARLAGTVTLCLAQSKGSTVTTFDHICIIPVGFRPSRPIRVSGESGGNFRGVVVMPDGQVLATGTWSSSISIVATVSYAV